MKRGVRNQASGRCWRFVAGVILLFTLVVTGMPVWACSPFIEEHPQYASASFRAHTTAFEHCPVSEPTYQRVVSQWLQARSPDLPVLQSLSLGRAVDFPWLSRHIAESALKLPRWKALVAATPRGRLDALAVRIFQDPALRGRLATPFENSGYLVTAVTYEKVLYGKARDHASHGGATMVPFDAQLWLRLAPRP